MRKRNFKSLYAAVILLALFALWTVLLGFIDVRSIGPNGSSVGFSSLNKAVHESLGVHMELYIATDWLSLIPVGVIGGFALLGLIQAIKRKNPLKVDFDILALGGFYVVVGGVFLLFEKLVINYRPVLIEGVLEASYPSSTTMLVMCVMPTAMMLLKKRIKNVNFRRVVLWVIGVYTVLMVAARLVSGVHWFTDIVGGALFSAGIVTMYHFVCGIDNGEKSR